MMYTYTRTKFVDATPQQCFDFLSDPSKMPQWDPNVKESKLITPGPVTVGSKLQQTRKQGNREFQTEAEVIEHTPPSRHSVRTNIMGVQAIFTYTFLPESGHTLMSVQATMQGKGFTKLLEGFVGKMCEKVDNDILERISEALPRRGSSV